MSDVRLLQALHRLRVEAKAIEEDVRAGIPVVQIDVFGNTAATAIRELGGYVERQSLTPSAPPTPPVVVPDLGIRQEPITLADMERFHARACYDANHGNVSKTARELGIDRRTLYRKMKAWGWR